MGRCVSEENLHGHQLWGSELQICCSVVSRAKKSLLPSVSDVTHRERDFGTQALWVFVMLWGLLAFRGLLGSLLQRCSGHRTLQTSSPRFIASLVRGAEASGMFSSSRKACLKKSFLSHLGQCYFWNWIGKRNCEGCPSKGLTL